MSKKVKRLPLGFELSGIKAHIKYEDLYDLALIYSKSPCKAGAVWTKNNIQAACITYNKPHITNDVHAIMINSGCANACTGNIGYQNCLSASNALAENLGICDSSVLLASTGIIGTQLPMDRILPSITKLVKKKGKDSLHIKRASKAILTTDTCTKLCALDCKLSNTKGIYTIIDSVESRDSKHSKAMQGRIFGMAKGSGMIHPNMATMLGFILTDIDIDRVLLQEALKGAVDSSFNQISVDGDTSTNDMVIVLSNGKLGNAKIVEKDRDFHNFSNALKKVCINLAKQIVADGEGANTLIQSHIKGADSLVQARAFSKGVISSNLLKTAIFGRDANWGRIICAMGYSGKFDISKIDLCLKSKKGSIDIIKGGNVLDFDNSNATKILDSSKVSIIIDLKAGDYEARAWGCDLSYDYVGINADYRS